MAEILPWFNLLLIPACGYIIGQDRKTVRLETKFDALQELMAAHVQREEKLLELIARK